jgi:CHAD domain-containing protein
MQWPTEELAPILVGTVRGQARKRDKGFADQSEEQRHQLRIAMKKPRYACELLAALSNRRTKRLRV